jgi:small-conductance mechanosensitive channel
MSSLLSYFPDTGVATFFRLVAILIVVLLVNRLLRLITNLLIKPAGSEARAAKAREQQTRTVAVVLYSASSKIVWAVALLTAAEQFGINVTPVATLAGLASLALGFGAQNLVRDARGALVTLSNGDIRTVANLSRDWSQAFVDVALSPQLSQEKALQALEAAAAELRADASWSQAIVDGPRILGLQNFDQNSSTVRLQVRTAPSRQDDVARELRRRIQLEFQRRDIPVSGVQRVEFQSAPVFQGDAVQPPST